MGRYLGSSARGTTPSWVMDALGQQRLPLMLLRLKELAQGMTDDLIATGFEADAGLQCIKVAVELVAQGNGDSNGQDTGGLVSFRTSSSHSGLHVCRRLREMGLKQALESLYFIRKIFIVNINS
jgi:hypothetical protein